MLKTLAITPERCSGAAIFIDNKIVFASSEERHSRIKSDESYPINSINNALKFSKLIPKELDRVLIAGKKLTLIPLLLGTYSRFSVKDNLKAMEDYWHPILVEGKKINILDVFQSKIDTGRYPFNSAFGKEFDYFKLEHPISDENAKKVSSFYKKAISNHLDIDESKIEHLDHHTCHAAYALYGSPIRDDNTLILTADAWGDDLSGTISIFDKPSNKIKRVKEYSHSDFQLGRMYRYVTLFLRMLPSDHEYKVMGLAPYYDGPVIKEVVKVFDDMQSLNGLEFKFNKNICNIYEHLKENLKHFRFDHIAAGIQSFTEKLVVEWVNNALSEFDCNNLVFSGGLSMNVKANMNIANIPRIKKFFICGGGGDETLSIGACYHYAELQKIKPLPLENLYLGGECTYVRDELNVHKFKITEFKNVEQIVGKLLEGKIVATCLGRMEMGPRSLGNRSILADPRDRKNVEIINRMIKNRDFWMPFAPVILYDYQEQLINNPKGLESPHMTIAFETKKGKEVIPAAVHPYDGTVRPEILKKDMNPRLWELIKAFYDKTGVPALLNTSFNLHGEPVVDTIKDALRVFENSGLQVLWLENHFLEKIEN